MIRKQWKVTHFWKNGKRPSWRPHTHLRSCFFSSLTIFIQQFHAKLTPFKVHQEEQGPSFSALSEPAPHAVSFTQQCDLAQRLEEDSLQPGGRRAESRSWRSVCLSPELCNQPRVHLCLPRIHPHIFLVSVLHHTLLRPCYLSIQLD